MQRIRITELERELVHEKDRNATLQNQLNGALDEIDKVCKLIIFVNPAQRLLSPLA